MAGHIFPQIYQNKYPNAFAESGDVVGLMGLKVSGVDLTEPDFDLRTCLHVACKAGRLAAVQWLCESGGFDSVEAIFRPDTQNVSAYDEAAKRAESGGHWSQVVHYLNQYKGGGRVKRVPDGDVVVDDFVVVGDKTFDSNNNNNNRPKARI